MKPLAYRIRPLKFEDIIGQDHLVGKYGTITKMVNNDHLSSLILYGSPGIGKTTIAYAIGNELNVAMNIFNASSDSKATLKKIIDDDKKLLIIDEIHRMNKDIQDYLLPYVESGEITIIGLTTVNPYHSVNPAVRSRCIVLKLKPLNDKDLEKILNKALKNLDENLLIDNDAKDYLIAMANGEVRSMLNMLEATYFTLTDSLTITYENAKSTIQKPSMGIDKNADTYYETLSGLHKSIRGSDVNASLHYLGKLLASEDFTPLIRRLYCICYEDISLANPGMGPKVKAACECALELGMPEAKLPLASIVVEMALSPKSNSTCLAIDAAMDDIEKGRSGSLPPHLKNTYSYDGNSETYKYPHDYPGGWVNQQYLPDLIKNAQYYVPKETSRYEMQLKERYDAINKAKTKK